MYEEEKEKEKTKLYKNTDEIMTSDPRIDCIHFN